MKTEIKKIKNNRKEYRFFVKKMKKPEMTSKERVKAAMNRTGYDRIPIKHEGTPEVNHMIMNHFGLVNTEQFLRVLGDDFRYIEPVYCGPELKKFPDGSIEGYFGERYKYAHFEGGRYLESCYQPFAGINKLEDLDRSHFPSADWFDYSTIRQQCESLQNYAICFGSAGDFDYINSISRARGMEEVLMDLIDDNLVFLEIMNARFEFYYHMHEQVLKAAEGLIDVVHIGEDLGTQNGLIISKDIFERHFAVKYKKYTDMAHSYGAKVMQHICGCCYELLPRLIELGLDIFDVVQPTTPEMDIANLKAEFGDKLIFCGSMCVQSTLAWGAVADVEKEVDRRLKLFEKGGLFLGPTHAIQVGSPLENILAMYRAAGSLCEKIDNSILSITKSSFDVDTINMSKLF